MRWLSYRLDFVLLKPRGWHTLSIITGLFMCSLTSCARQPSESAHLPESARLRSAELKDATPGPGIVVATLQQPALPSSGPPYAETLAQFNRAAGLMEKYEYALAATDLLKVLEAAPDWTAARVNLGLAYMNMFGATEPRKRLGSTAEMVDAARKTFLALVDDPEFSLRAHFCLGMLEAYLGEPDKALEHFRPVYEHDPQDKSVAFCYAKALYKLNRFDEAIPILEDIVRRDPGFVSAVYILFLGYSRTGRRDEAPQLAARVRELNADELAVGTFVVDDKYGMAGRYSFMVGADGLPLPPPAPPEARRILFDPEPLTIDATTQTWQYDAGTILVPGLATADVDGDGDLDLLISGLDERGTAQLFLNDGIGRFVPGATLAQAAVSPCFGDIDNDGDVDLWFGRAGTDQIWLNDGSGGFEVSAHEALADSVALTPVARLADIDGDGDLDLLAMRQASGDVPAGAAAEGTTSSVWVNNTDGSYTDMADSLGLQLPQTAVASVVSDDFDNDFDLDLLVFPAHGPALAWENFRVGQHRRLAAAETGLDTNEVWSATSGDPNKDGQRDLLVFTAQGVRLFMNQGGFAFREDEQFGGAWGGLRGTGGQFADFDNDGDLDILITDASRRDGTQGLVLLVNNWPEASFADAAQRDPGFLLSAVETHGKTSCVAADFTGNGRCDVLLVEPGSPARLFQNLTPGGNWIELDLVGKRPQDRTARSNNSAIGARVEVKTGELFQQFVVGGSAGPVANMPLRVHAGLGEHAKVDWLRVIWPDAILQGEVELAANRRLVIEEESRKPSSCPYLFAWTGSHFEFVADFGGVGGLGYLVSPGQYAPPDPTEYLPLPRLAPRDGRYELQVLTPLEEITYLDEVRLLAVDHPWGTEVQPHEMMAINLPPPEFEIFVIDERLRPQQARNHLGQDVTDLIAHADRQYAGATQPDPRFVGLAEPHFVELDFGSRLADITDNTRLILFLQGWVEYGYSATNFAASQAGLRTEAPSVTVLRDGQWVDLLTEAGYPAGLNHAMTLDLTGLLLATDQRLRVSSNMELYWDEVYLGIHRESARVSVHAADPAYADLHFRGYPRAYSPDGRHPNLYDYHNLDRNVSWKLMAGDYTRFGDVRELLREPDDCFVIMGHGEEVTLHFNVEDFPPVPAGCRRSFLLQTDSYCKDMDLYTAYPDTVEPLPFHGMSGYPYGPNEGYPDTERTRSYRQDWNTRHVRNR